MIPVDAIKKIRRFDIHYDDHHGYITGFSFFDKDGALLWKIGYTIYSWLKKETIKIAENEVIVGVVGKHSWKERSLYTDF